ncbi:hypothetical protein SynA1825c_02614 [Synechococcus sp. A18-25c]|nr:hypothetical protein SynA1825c_02614 [Synechococcus sp. A18-25c]
MPMQLLVFPDHPLLKSAEIMLDQIMKYPLEHRPPKVYLGAESLLVQAVDFFSAATDKKQTVPAGSRQQGNADTVD